MPEDLPPRDPAPELHGLDPGELLARALHTVRPTGGTATWLPPEPAELARLLPQYRIDALLGHGGMGAVYRGVQPALDRAVAIKLLPAELSGDEHFCARFQREARTLARLQHPGIVAVYDFGQTSEGHLYFVMELVEGTDLGRLLHGPGLQPDQALELTSQVCEALHYAHCKGVIHRDIKPGNILITLEGRAKLADFGLSRPFEEDVTALTRSDVVMGTSAYMAPEQHAGQSDPRSDIFSLGIMLYEMLTGQRPRGSFPPPSRKVRVDVRIDEVVLKALEEDPQRRYQEVSEMKTEVDHIRTTVAPAPAPARVGPSPARWWGVGVAIAVLLPMLGIAGYVLINRKSPLDKPAPVPWPVEVVTPSPTPRTKPTSTPTRPSATPVASAASPSSPPPTTGAPSVSWNHPSGLREALLEFAWVYETVRSDRKYNHRLVFAPDGRALSFSQKVCWVWAWKLSDARTVMVDQNFHARLSTLVFDGTFSKFTGTSSDGAVLTGHRAEPLTASDRARIESSPKPSPSPFATPPPAASQSASSPAPSPSPIAPPPAPEIKSAQQALLAFSWKFFGPGKNGIVSFGADGSVAKSWRQVSPWRWTATGPRTFRLESVKSGEKTTMTFDEAFTRFEGHEFGGKTLFVGRRSLPRDVPASAEATPDARPADTAPVAGGLVLPENWSGLLANASGGQSLAMADLHALLTPYGTAKPDVAAHPEVAIYEGPTMEPGMRQTCRITYLMPLPKALAALCPHGAGLGSSRKAVAPGLPDGMVIYEYDVRVGIYNRLCILTDRATPDPQVVSLLLRSEHTNWYAGAPFRKALRDWHTFDYLNTVNRAQSGVKIDTRVADLRKQGGSIVINTTGGDVAAKVLPPPGLLVRPAKFAPVDTSTWYVPQPLIDLCLYCLDHRIKP